MGRKLKPHFPKKKSRTRVPNHRLVHCQGYDVDIVANVKRTVRVRAESSEQAAELAVNRTKERNGALSAWNAKLIDAKVEHITQPAEPQ